MFRQCKNNGGKCRVPIAARLAIIDRALALPTLRVVLGSLFGGGGGGRLSEDEDMCIFLGSVEYGLATASMLLKAG